MRINLSLYRLIPRSIRGILMRNSFFRGLINRHLKREKDYLEVQVPISRDFGEETVSFDFIASIKTAERAVKKGIENKLLKQSLKLIRKRSKNDDCIVIDIGCNFGFLSMVWSKTICKYGHIYAFEAHPSVAESFKKTASINGMTNIEIKNMAIGLNKGEVKFLKHGATSHLLNLDEEITRFANETILIKMTTIDNFVETNSSSRYDLIKIDVDGIEFDILKGGEKTIKYYKPILIVETNGNPKIIDFLKSLDYSIHDMELNPYNDDQEIPINIFGIPNE